jgi:hypothetical protein
MLQIILRVQLFHKQEFENDIKLVLKLFFENNYLQNLVLHCKQFMPN